MKVVVKDSYIFVLSGGKLSIFDKSKILAVDSTSTIADVPIWTPIKSTTKTSNITDFYVDKTKIVTVETSSNPDNNSIVIYDFWHNKTKPQIPTATLPHKRRHSLHTNDKLGNHTKQCKFC